MTERIPAGLEGQIADFSPLEMWWDKNRRSIYTMLTVAALAVAGFYAWKYFRNTRRDNLWSGVASVAKLDFAYGTENPILRPPEGQDPYSRNYMVLQATHMAAQSLLTELQAHLAKANLTDIEREINEARGTAAEPLLLWIAAKKAAEKLDWDYAERTLRDLQQRFPQHFLTVETKYPPQYREPLEKKPAGEPDPKKNEPVKLKDAEPGSAVGRLLASIANERKHRAEYKHLYEAPAPDADSKTVVVVTTVGTFKIRFYPSKAPKTVENFLKLVEAKFYDKLRVHEVVRPGTQFPDAPVAAEFELGLASTKDEDERSKWIPKTDAPTIEWENSGISHFPYMVSMAQASAGKSSGERIWINATDAARSADGMRVVFGTVVEGKEVIDTITQSILSSEDENRFGRGRPSANVVITEMRIE